MVGRSGICVLAFVVAAAVGSTGLAAAGQAKGPKHVAFSPPPALAPAAATGAFGLDLMRALPPGNLVLSPDSIAAALAMTGTGAAGPTAAQIADTLHLSGPARFAEVGDLQQAIAAGQAAAAGGDPEAPTLAIANGLFVQQGFPLEPAFLSGLGQHFGAAAESVDFSGDPDGSRDRINGWVSEHTGGLIPQLLGSLPPEMRLALANAVYLKADWLHPFKRRKTEPAAFHNNAGNTTVPFMHETESLRYGQGKGFRAVELPYRASTMSLLVVLPVRSRIGSLQRRLDARGLSRIVHGLSSRTVELSLPRFHLSMKAEMNQPLESLGLTTAFTESADFSRMTTAARLKIGFVQHAADFTVDEEGTTAAAATVVGMVALSGEAIPRDPIIFNANRPFLFFLRDRTTGAILFAGRLTSP